ncbi:hypothetical protein [Ammoniphilus sp. 3BR4]|uniref:hypothetical protein n=1 Tax=Ammoniphilus sp. 3BR4 TaxID=3158265 RepID=UPI003465150B
MDIKLMAEVYRLGLLIKYFNAYEVIQWVDKIIETTNVKDIPTIFFDLSLSKDKRVIIELLGSIEGDVEKGLPTKIMLGLLYKRLDSQDTATIINMANELAYMTNDDWVLSATIKALVDQYEEALKGYGNRNCTEETIKEYVSEAVEVIKDFLADYKEYAGLWKENYSSYQGYI